MNVSRKNWYLILLGLMACFAVPVSAQGPVLDAYVKQGLESNLQLKQQRLTYEQSLEALHEARGMFLPSVDASISANEIGGQALDVGDLLNPVYSTLNQVTGTNAFPTDVSFTLPAQRQTTVQAVLPVLSLDIIHNYRARANLSAVEKDALQVSARALVAEIKTAYFNYAKTVRLVELYDQTLDLLEENLRVNERLVESDKATTESVYRARAELSEMQQKRADALQMQNAAQRHFNFLLNRDLDTHVEVDTLSETSGDIAIADVVAETPAGDRGGREEFAQLRHSIQAADQLISLHTTSYLPSLALVATYGFQGETFDYASNLDYGIVTLQARWNLFDGFRTTAKRQGAVLEREKLTRRLAELRQQVLFEVRTAHDDLTVGRAAIQTSQDRLASAQRTFEMVTRKYELGAAPQIEYLDARTAYTNAASNAIITRYDYYIRAANYERVTAAYPLGQLTR